MNTPEVLVDANILLRHLTGHPPAMAHRAGEIMRAAEQGRVALVVTSLILAECVWVLERVYRKSRQAIADALLALLHAPGIAARERDALVAALGYYSTVRTLDFADAYLAGLAATVGPSHIASFDKGLKRVSDVTVVSSPDF